MTSVTSAEASRPRFPLSRVAALPIVLGLSACYSTSLDKSVPEGPAAYSVIEPRSSAATVEPQRLSRNDTVTINVFQEPELSIAATSIDDGGNISVPLLGSIPAAGLTADELARSIEDRLSPEYLLQPKVTVTAVTSALRRVTVEGEVMQPGVFPVTGPTTLLQSIALARGTKRTAKTDQVVVFRTVDGQQLAARFDLKNIRAAKDPDPLLAPDDIVVVGFSEERGLWEDFLRTIPVLNVFGVFDNNNRN